MRYQFQSDPGQFSYRPKLFTDAIKYLVTINFIIYILQSVSGQERILFQLFGIVPKNTWSLFMIWQPLTYLFFHGGIWHVLINMFVLWMFGTELESFWGKKEFLKYYFLTGVGAGIVTILFSINSSIPVVGASGAVYGILLAYGLLFPNRTVYIYGIIPIKSLWFVIFIGAMAFFSSFSARTNISHLTHLSGMAIGFVYLRSRWRWKDIRFLFRKRIVEFKTQQKEKVQTRQTKLQQEIDRILDHINQVGFDGLTDEEKERLYEASRKLSRDRKKD